MNYNNETKSLYSENDDHFLYEINNFFSIENELPLLDKIKYLCKIKNKLCSTRISTGKKPIIKTIKKYTTNS